MRKVVEVLQRHGFQAYPVGGGVRDLLLGRRAKDWDVATDARPAQVQSVFAKVIPTGIEHGTVTVVSAAGQKVEVTTFRAETGYSDGRHPDRVRFLGSLAEDLKRRDFTINAMAIDLVGQRLLDPLGGRKDLRRGLVRAVGKAHERFSEDGLRALRAVRFACLLNFRIEKLTFAAIGQSLDVFRLVAPERVREELLKLLGASRADRGIEMLRQSGLLAEIVPELLSGVGFRQNPFHRYDVYRHCLECLRRARGDPLLKLAVLLHDVGKPQSAEGPSGERTFYGHEKLSAAMADTIMARLRFSNAERERVRILIENHMFNYEPAWSDGAVRRLMRKVGPERLEDLWEMRRADCWGRGIGVRESLKNLEAIRRRVARVLAEQSALKVTDLALDGHDVMRLLGCPAGPRVGRALEALLEKVIDDPSLNNREALSKILLEIGRNE